MRPLRSFIMWRTQALHSRYTAVRLVAITASQSSGFMRSSSMSRVIAALLTRMVGGSAASSSCAMSASIEAESAASSNAPRPLYPCDASDAATFATPSSLVAVPMTRAPAAPSARAMALPIPREAPVTSAIWFSSIVSPRSDAERRVDGSRILQREEGQVRSPLDAAVEAREHLSGTVFDDLRNPSTRKRTQRLCPAHRARDLSH